MDDHSGELGPRTLTSSGLKLEWLESFVAFAETRNFTRAAERVHLSQPALHVQIKRLTETVGVPLYRRQGRRMVLTERGRELEAFAREITGRTRAFLTELREGADDSPVVLCAGAGTHLSMIAGTLRSWVEAGHRLSLLSGDQDFIADAVHSGRAHLGIAPLPAGDHGLRSHPFRIVGQAAVIREDHPLASRRRLRLAHLAGEPLILPPAGRPHRIVIANAFRAAGRDLAIGVEAGGWELMMLYASLGLGIAVVNDYCSPPAGTRRIPVPELPSLEYRVFVREGGFLPAPAKELLALLRKTRRQR